MQKKERNKKSQQSFVDEENGLNLYDTMAVMTRFFIATLRPVCIVSFYVSSCVCFFLPWIWWMRLNDISCINTEQQWNAEYECRNRAKEFILLLMSMTKWTNLCMCCNVSTEFVSNEQPSIQYWALHIVCLHLAGCILIWKKKYYQLFLETG